MKHGRLILLTVFLFACGFRFAYASGCAQCNTFSFKENKGQWPAQVLYKADLQAGSLFLEHDGFTFNLIDTNYLSFYRKRSHHNIHYEMQLPDTLWQLAYKMKFQQCNLQAAVTGYEQSESYYNYFIGNDKSTWTSYVHAYRKVIYENIYPQIDLVVYSQNNQLKFDWVLNKGADFSAIRILYQGLKQLQLLNEQVQITTEVNTITEAAPVAYDAQTKARIACNYALHGNELSYELPGLQKVNTDVVIDPSLIFSTYSGSTSDNFGYTATYDSRGNLYSGSSAFGNGYPTTLGAYQTTWAGGDGISATNPGTDYAISKFAADGSTLLYSTFIGGSNDELPHSLFVNANDECFILGTTSSPDFPVTPGAYDVTFNGGTNITSMASGVAVVYVNGSDINVSRLSVDGSMLLASTYVGGSGDDGLNLKVTSTFGGLRYNYADELRGEILLDENDNVYIASCTQSNDFPITAGAIQTTNAGMRDACVFKMDNNLTTLVWSTYYGGNDDDAAYSLDFGLNNELYFTGGTRSLDFPSFSGAYQTSYQGGRADGFIVEMHRNGAYLMRATLYGTSDYDQIYFVEKDKNGFVYVLGQTEHDSSFYIENAAYNRVGGKMFITKFNGDLDTRIWSTAFGNALTYPDISPTAFLVDVCNSVYLAGWGGAVNGTPNGTSGLDITGDAYQSTTDNNDFYLMVLKDDASAITYGSYFGGSVSEEHVDGGTSRFDRNGVIYQAVCAGCGSHDDFPIYPSPLDVVSSTNNSVNCNLGVFKFDFNLPIVLADFEKQTVCLPDSVHFVNTSRDSTSTTFTWHFGDGTSSNVEHPVHLYGAPGVYTVKLVLFDPQSCNLTDSIEKQILVLSNGTDTLPEKVICFDSSSIQIGLDPIHDTTLTFQWYPAAGLNLTNIPNPIATPGGPATYYLVISNGLCFDTLVQNIRLFSGSVSLTGGTVLCPFDTICLHVENLNPSDVLSYNWSPNAYIVSGDFTSDPCVVPVDTTLFYVVATNEEGCKFSDSIQVNVAFSGPSVYASAAPDTIAVGGFSQLSSVDSNAVSIEWDADNSLNNTHISNPVATPTHTTTYVITATDLNGCIAKDSVTVYVKYTPCPEANVFVPSGFSPNGDGLNDFLFVRGNGIEQLHFMVYDRWGQMMFETRDKNVGWNGEYKGKKMEPAVFGWYVEGVCAETGEDFKLKGNVTLMK